MSFGNLPPQAYTKETLTKAFNWLQTQPEYVRESVKTPDALVALFAKVQKGNTKTVGAWDTEPSSKLKSFKEELKSMAHEIRPLEDAQQTLAVATEVSFTAQSTTTTIPINALPALDDRSRNYLKTVKEQLNLSSEAEALRVLITLGFNRFQMIFPEGSPNPQGTNSQES